MHSAAAFAIEAEIELVLPSAARAADGVVPKLRSRVALGEVGCVRRDLVRDRACLHVVAVWRAPPRPGDLGQPAKPLELQ